MANRIAKLGRERSLKTLAERLFVIEGPGAERKLRHAEAALLRANPELATPEGFASGKTVIIPGDIGLIPTDRVIAARQSADGLLDETGTRLDLAGKTLAGRYAEGRKQAEETLARVTDRRLVQQIKRVLPEGTAILSKARETIGKQAEEDKTREERFAKAMEEAQARLAALRALAERQR
ncbi:hypothetical protein [Rhodovulum marinum]|uniref:Uncharacterized protein n=1 Tax=Rhodovulum marinum TaxID=320662 RepID=A0A4R2Q290_9RHOB|nr:hypothetical protein [Rhodovulum marinum]TCP41854.1 hypothetical protein EV662_104198 [Rhodovulum marinum]